MNKSGQEILLGTDLVECQFWILVQFTLCKQVVANSISKPLLRFKTLFLEIVVVFLLSIPKADDKIAICSTALVRGFNQWNVVFDAVLKDTVQ